MSESDKGQIMMSRQLGQSISKAAGLVGFSWLVWLLPAKNGLTNDNW